MNQKEKRRGMARRGSWSTPQIQCLHVTVISLLAVLSRLKGLAAKFIYWQHLDLVNNMGNRYFFDQRSAAEPLLSRARMFLWITHECALSAVAYPQITLP